MRWIALVAMLSACTQRTAIRHAGQEINEEGTLVMRNGEEREVTFIGFVPQGLVVAEQGQSFSVGYEHVRELRYDSHASGAWQGFKYGALTGAAIGVLWGLAVANDVEDEDFLGEPGEAMMFGALIFAIGGMVWGPIIGGIKGSTTVYAVDEP